MDVALALAIAFGVLLVGLALGVHIGVTLGLSGLIGLWLMLGSASALVNLQTLPFHLVSKYAFAVIPMFILMGQLAFSTGITTEIYEAAYKWLSGLRGGLVMTTVTAAAFFGALSGSSVASAAVFTRLSLPEMLRFGYSPALSAGSIAAAGTLAATIPPSILIVLYGIITEESVKWLLIAGIIPGFLTATVYMVVVYVILKVRPELCPPSPVRFPLRERIVSLRGLWTVALLFGLVMGGIYTGVFTPTAAGAVGASGVLLVALFRRRLGLQTLREALRETTFVTSTVFTIFIGGYFFGRFLALTGTVTGFANFIANMPVAPVVILLGFFVMYLFLGTFLESASMLVLTLPLTHPAVVALGYDPVWFGIEVILLVEIGLMTPPVGLNVYVVYGAARGSVELKDVFMGAIPFMFAGLIVVGLLVAFPSLALWLPSMMK